MKSAQVVSVNGYRYTVDYFPNVKEIGYIWDPTEKRIQINGLNPNKSDELAHINFILDCIQAQRTPTSNNGMSGKTEVQPTPLIILLGLEDMI